MTASTPIARVAAFAAAAEHRRPGTIGIDRVCCVGDCVRPAKTRGMCGMHAERVRAHGTTELPVRERITTCTVNGCEQTVNSHGLCPMHDRRRLLYGDPLCMHPKYDRWAAFWGKVDFSGPCWVWQGGRTTTGYGAIRNDYAHRVAWELLVGEIPEGLHIDHLCRNTLCVNPDHLEPCTPRTNTLRSMAPAAILWRAGHCSRGHAWTPENTYWRPDGGGRQCRECIKIRRRAKVAAA